MSFFLSIKVKNVSLQYKIEIFRVLGHSHPLLVMLMIFQYFGGLSTHICPQQTNAYSWACNTNEFE